MRFLLHRRKHQKLILSIEQADDAQLSGLIQAVVRRSGQLFPDWDILFLSLPKDPEQRRQQLEQMLQALKEETFRI